MFVRKHHYMNCALMAPTDIATLQGWSGVANVIATLLIGVVAALVAIQSKRIAAASILPFLVVDEELREDSLEYNITNVGLGPAIIKQIEVTYPAEPYILRVVKEQVESDRQQLQGFLQSDAVTRQAGGKHHLLVDQMQTSASWSHTGSKVMTPCTAQVCNRHHHGVHVPPHNMLVLADTLCGPLQPGNSRRNIIRL